MFYQIKANKVSILNGLDALPLPGAEDAYIGLFPLDALPDASSRYHIDEILLEEASSGKSAKFESFDGFDFLCLNILDHENLYVTQKRVLIYLQKQFALLFCEDLDRVREIIELSAMQKGENNSFCRLIYDFLNRLTVGGTHIFDTIEKEIMNLEQALITSKKRDCVKEIISLRKRLMILKKYYEQLLDVLEDLQENENKIFDKKTLRYFHVLENRTDRQYHNILNLRDYVTQVREAYQAEVDISLNETMKLFTVLTAIFLPLSLIVGWYGMNFQMPEYNWEHGYLMVIVLSVLVILYMIAYFKKKKWF